MIFPTKFQHRRRTDFVHVGTHGRPGANAAVTTRSPTATRTTVNIIGRWPFCYQRQHRRKHASVPLPLSLPRLGVRVDYYTLADRYLFEILLDETTSGRSTLTMLMMESQTAELVDLVQRRKKRDPFCEPQSGEVQQHKVVVLTPCVVNGELAVPSCLRLDKKKRKKKVKPWAPKLIIPPHRPPTAIRTPWIFLVFCLTGSPSHGMPLVAVTPAVWCCCGSAAWHRDATATHTTV